MRSLKVPLAAALAMALFSSYLGVFDAADACCSLAPAHFSKTKGWVGEAQKDGRLVHILGYSNSVQNLVGKGGKPHGNAMFLPIPSVPGTMTDKNILDTSLGLHIISDMEEAVRPQTRGELRADDPVYGTMGAEPVQVFEHGIYTIVIAQHASDIPAALSRVPAAKRPDMNEKIFAAYEKWYPGWTFALCCFDTRQQAEAEPMLWWYQPKYPNVLFFPAVDCHTGAVPNLAEPVQVDHFLAASSKSLDELRKKTNNRYGHVTFRDRNVNGDVKALLPQSVIGSWMNYTMPNGDFLLSVSDVRAGNMKPQRVLPPGSTASTPARKFADLAEGRGF